jgi:type III secretion protein S
MVCGCAVRIEPSWEIDRRIQTENFTMNSTLTLFEHSLMLAVFLSAPLIVVASVLGLVVALTQGVFQIQDQTLPFAIKLAAVAVTLALLGGWIAAQVVQFALSVFAAIPAVGK